MPAVTADTLTLDRIALPVEVAIVLRDVVLAMADGNAVTVAPHHTTLTTQEAADLLTTALTRDMRAVQASILSSQDWDEPMLEPPERVRAGWRAQGLPESRLHIPRHGETLVWSELSSPDS